jgi:hypothetical protein
MTTQLILNLPEARKARDRGIQKAIDTACKVNPQWPEKAFNKLKEFVREHIGEFKAEDIRSYAAMDDDFPLPKSERAWGGILAKAIRDRIIKKVGIGPVKNKKAQMANANTYVKA